MAETPASANSWTTDILERLRGLQLDPAREAEIIEELSIHLDERFAQLRRAMKVDPLIALKSD